MKIRKKRKFKKGFSVGEVMLASFVMSIGLIAAVNLLVSSLKRSFDSRDQIIASGLAQEGIELVINVRDNNLLDTTSEFEDIPVGNSDGDFCIDNSMDLQGAPALDHPASCGGDLPNDQEYVMYFDDTNSVYTHNDDSGANDATKFKRKIAVEDDPLNPGSKVFISMVYWGGEDTFPASCVTEEKCIENRVILTLRN